MKKIFVADENQEALLLYERYLSLNDYLVRSFSSLSSLEIELAASFPDLLVLDLEWKEGDGFQTLRKVKNQGNIPVIIVTSRSGESDRILSFELGCDDYLVKPCSMKELVLRIERLFRQLEGGSPSNERLVFHHGSDELSYDDKRRLFLLNGEVIPFTISEIKIMECFIHYPGSLFSRQDLIDKCFGYEAESYERIIDTHIKNIRMKLGPGGLKWIETIRGYGYRFMAMASPAKG